MNSKTGKPYVQIRGEFCVEERPQPCSLVIFGASGDLTERKLIPAMFQLYRRGLLAKNFYILGCARTEMDDASFRRKVAEELPRVVRGATAEQIEAFTARLGYLHGQYDDTELHRRVLARLQQVERDQAIGPRRLFYLATPPNLYIPVARCLADCGLADQPTSDLAELTSPTGDGQRGWARVVFEKPFGRDLESALAVDAQLHQCLAENQIYRIDHYLGKETVQNILMFRFANAIFEPIWNRAYIDSVQITAAESIGVGHRAGYFEQAGVLRDMFQNHMLQMLALVAMEAPASFNADRVRDEKVKLLRSIRPFPLGELDRWLVRGQYGAGAAADGSAAPAYREEKGVAPDSPIETYVAAKVCIDNWRWQGVPFYLRSGKRLRRRVSEIAITFKGIPHSIFNPIAAGDFTANQLVFNVQPDEGISLSIQAKHPGPKLCIATLAMDWCYREVFDEEPPEAYERLLLDAMLGDQTLFVRHDDVAVSWALMTPVLEAWERGGHALNPYAPGTWGPEQADQLLAQDGRRWRKPETETTS